MERCGIMVKMWNPQRLQIHETCAFVARQGEDGGVHIRMDVFLAELLIEALHGALGRIVVLAKMTEHNIFDARMVYFGQEASRLHIAQMSERTGDTLFQNIGIGAFFQHFHIVIGFNDEVVRLADLLLHHLIQHTDICGDSQSTAFILKMIAHRSTAIVHHRESLDDNIEQLKRLHGFDFVEQRSVELFGSLALNESLQAVSMSVNRYGIVFGESLQTQHVVNVVVCDKDGLDVLSRQILLQQLLLELFRGNAYINENTLILPAHIVAIAAAARGKAAKHERR